MTGEMERQLSIELRIKRPLAGGQSPACHAKNHLPMRTANVQGTVMLWTPEEAIQKSGARYPICVLGPPATVPGRVCREPFLGGKPQIIGHDAQLFELASAQWFGAMLLTRVVF